MVKIGNIKRQNLPFPVHDVDPHLIRQYLGRPHAPPTPQLRRFMHFCIATSQTPHWLQWGPKMGPHFRPKFTPSCGPIPKPNNLRYPCTNPTYHPKPYPYPISLFVTVQWTDQQMLEEMFDDYRPP